MARATYIVTVEVLVDTPIEDGQEARAMVRERLRGGAFMFIVGEYERVTPTTTPRLWEG